MNKKTKKIIAGAAVLTLLAAAAAAFGGGAEPQEAQETPSPEPEYIADRNARPEPPAPPFAPESGISPPSAPGPEKRTGAAPEADRPGTAGHRDGRLKFSDREK